VSGTNKQPEKYITKLLSTWSNESKKIFKTLIGPHEVLSSEQNSLVTYYYPSKSNGATKETKQFLPNTEQSEFTFPVSNSSGVLVFSSRIRNPGTTKVLPSMSVL